ncbi:hypothetical protein SGLAM104S_05628 [Streptomyces glaucescens]
MGVGSGRTDWITATTTISSSTSGVQIFTRRTAVRSGVCGGGGVFVSSASRSSGGFGGNGCWVVRSGPIWGTAAVTSAGTTGPAGAAGSARSAGFAGAAVRGLRTAGSSSCFSATNVLVRSASSSPPPGFAESLTDSLGSLDASDSVGSLAGPLAGSFGSSAGFALAASPSFSMVVGWSTAGFGGRTALKTVVGWSTGASSDPAGEEPFPASFPAPEEPFSVSEAVLPVSVSSFALPALSAPSAGSRPSVPASAALSSASASWGAGADSAPASSESAASVSASALASASVTLPSVSVSVSVSASSALASVARSSASSASAPAFSESFASASASASAPASATSSDSASPSGSPSASARDSAPASASPSAGSAFPDGDSSAVRTHAATAARSSSSSFVPAASAAPLRASARSFAERIRVAVSTPARATARRGSSASRLASGTGPALPDVGSADDSRCFDLSGDSPATDASSMPHVPVRLPNRTTARTPGHHGVRTMYQCPVCGLNPSGRRERHTYRFPYEPVTHPRQTNVRGVTLSFIHAGRHGWAGAAEHFRRSFCCWRWTRPRVPPHSRSRSTWVWPEHS